MSKTYVYLLLVICAFLVIVRGIGGGKNQDEKADSKRETPAKDTYDDIRDYNKAVAAGKKPEKKPDITREQADYILRNGVNGSKELSDYLKSLTPDEQKALQKKWNMKKYTG